MADPEATPESEATGPPPAVTSLSPNEAVGHYVTMWKTSIEVQQHFNGIEWRIRGLALTVATFALGAAGVAARDKSTLGPISLGSGVLVLGLILWYAFYFVDRLWYHPLLKAAVAEGAQLENAISEYLPEAHLTAGITERSPQPVGHMVAFLAGRKGTAREGDIALMHSDHKLRWFYRVGASTFVVGALALQIGSLMTSSPSSPQNPQATVQASPLPAHSLLPSPTPSP